MDRITASVFFCIYESGKSAKNAVGRKVFIYGEE